MAGLYLIGALVLGLVLGAVAHYFFTRRAYQIALSHLELHGQEIRKVLMIYRAEADRAVVRLNLAQEQFMTDCFRDYQVRLEKANDFGKACYAHGVIDAKESLGVSVAD